MSNIKKSVFFLALFASTPLAISSPVTAETAAAAGATTENRALRALEDALYQDSLDNNFVGRQRANLAVDQFTDYSVGRVRAAALRSRKHAFALAAVDPERLNGNDLTTYRILKFELAGATMAEQAYWLTFDLTSYLAPGSFLSAQQVFAAHPLNTPQDVRHYIRLAESYATMLDTLTAKVAEQAQRGVYLPRPALPVIRGTWQAIGATTNTLRPADSRVAKLAPVQRAKLLAAVDAIVAKRIDPGFAQLAATIGETYAAKAPESVGIGQYPGGKAVYRELIRTYATLPLTPMEIHERGLKGVADVKARMAAIREQLGFHGTAREFYNKISTDPRFIANTPADVEATYWRYIHAMEPKVPTYFHAFPKTPYGVKRLPEMSEAGQTFGYYGVPTPTEPKGLYNYNASNLPKRSLINAGTLIYHELIPGHHFQISTQYENPELSPYRKQYNVGTFIEGWAEYAASLGIEMQLYDSPEALYGRYINELFLAGRLVVDTGMNDLGWSLEKARAYMIELGSMSDIEVNSETLRYSVGMPGQALSYRIGYEEIWTLRRHAEHALGERFDIRDFHDVVLRGGSRPIPVLAQDVEAYIAARLAVQPD